MAQGRRRINDHLEVLEDHHERVLKAIKDLASTSIMVGIPSDKEQPHFDENGMAAKGTEKRQDTPSGIGNANIGYIHETGAPAANIHARPWLSPGVRNSQREWTAYMKRAGELAFQGKMTAMDQALHGAGMKAVQGVKDRIQSNIPPPLAASTIARRRIRSTGSSYRRIATTAEQVTALIDTSQMINAISYVLRHRGKK